MDPSGPARYVSPAMPIPRAPRAVVPATALALALLLPAPASGQRSLDGIRLGLAFGGTGFIAASFEFFNNDRALDLTVGTWGFQDLSLSLVAKEVLGASAFRPTAGVGLWVVWSSPPPENPDATRSGITVLARAPIGVDWNVQGRHYLEAHINVSRALWIRRTVPGDDRPLNRRLVPLPGLVYRWDPGF
jgi:hypothetical protein